MYSRCATVPKHGCYDSKLTAFLLTRVSQFLKKMILYRQEFLQHKIFASFADEVCFVKI